jgi:hypothetical protein
MTDSASGRSDGVSRREFLRTASLAGASLATAAGAMARGSEARSASSADRIRVGVIGCGGRGTGAAEDCVNASPDVVIAALGDLFPDRVEAAFERLAERLPKANHRGAAASGRAVSGDPSLPQPPSAYVGIPYSCSAPRPCWMSGT